MLDSYWPSETAINACIKNEAETADVSVLLAVHQPSPLVQRHAASGNITSATEKDLLDAFLTDNVPTGALLMPITGPSGVGKSHIVRWLDAQLQRSAKRDRMHIIRIPKSASLRTVVDLILEPLKDDPRYAKARDDLTRAVGEVNLKEAVITFRAHLQNALTAQRARMVTQIRENSGRKDLKILIGHAEKLPQMFADGALEQHFIDNVLSRVVSRALRGRTEDQGDDDALPQFQVSDLILPETVPVNQASRPVHDYYLRNIATVEADRLQPVVDMLNEAVDPAIGNVFRLEQNAGGMTLQDIILAVREILLEDKKDLVLLVEDFAALAGIQEVLLKVCIQEGERDGKKVRATMRTAMALTDGYLSFRDTILTRAQREWVIGGQAQTPAEIKRGVVEMVGAYLNAARWGEAELQRLFHQRGPEQTLTDWLPAWRNEDLTDADSETIAAFGYNARNEALFPFNRQAVETLSERHLQVGGQLVFNPRRVINEILRNTLLMRKTFEARAFPPPGYEGLAPNANVAIWIGKTHQPEAASGRLRSLLAAWGGDPTDTTAISHIHPAIFQAFNLPTPSELAGVGYKPEIVPLNPIDDAERALPKVDVEIVAPVQPTEDPKITDLRAKLDAWSKGGLLSQNEARDLRNSLFEMLKDAIDLPTLRIRQGDVKPTWISIPNARNNPQAGPILQVCEDSSDEYGIVRAAFVGAVRFVMLNGKRWTYPEADDDYIACALLIDHLVGQLKPKFIADAKAEVSTLGRALITQSRIAGLSPPVKPSGVDGVLNGLFAVPETRSVVPIDDDWDELHAGIVGPIGAIPAREALQTEVFARAACFQGDSGRTPFAVDIVRLLDTIGGEAPAAESSETLPPALKPYIRQIAETRIRPRLNSIIAKLEEFKTKISEFVDEGFDKNAFAGDLQNIVLLLSKTGTTPAVGPNLKEFERDLVEFRQSAYVDLVTKVTTIIEAQTDQTPRLLNALGSIDLSLIARTTSFLRNASQLVAASEIRVSREESDRGQSDPADLARELTAMLHLVAGTTAQHSKADS